MNAERILIAAECIGDARWFIKKATDYANDRYVFGREIGKNQGIQFPIAEAHMQTEAANLMVEHAARVFENGGRAGAGANMAKYLRFRSIVEGCRHVHADPRRFCVC